MLLVWDIHINTRFKDKILESIKASFAEHAQEKNIIFFWDFVYHFSYDRSALLELYNLFLELFTQGKNVWILAGNHDRLGNSFVFEEAQKAFNIINETLKAGTGGQIHFVTTPRVEMIEWEKILLLPYFIESWNVESWKWKTNPIFKPIQDICDGLKTSVNKHEAFSGQVNEILLHEVEKSDQITVFHHYYINGKKFPGQKSQFSYKDTALSELFLDIPGLKMVSAHLHQGFTYQNYLCLGSVRSTTSLETNQNKYIFKYDTQSQSVQAIPLAINPYIRVNADALITKDFLLKELEKVNVANEKNFADQTVWKVSFPPAITPLLENISLSVQVDILDYEKIDEVIDPDLRKICKDIKLRKNAEDMDELMANFQTSGKNLTAGFTDWKTILKEYVQRKYGNDYPKYEKILKELKLV